MPKQNEIRRGYEIGKKPFGNKFIWAACQSCGKTRWVVLNVKENKPNRLLCKSCSVRLMGKGNIGRVAHNRLNLINKKFNRLTVLEFVGIQSDGHRESLWKCRCDCGKEIVTTGNSLTSGNTKSCGCYHKDRTRELFSSSIEDLTVSRVLCDYRKSAHIKGHLFELSREHIASLVNEDCYYCGAKPSNKLRQHNRVITYQGIDRLDNTKGYTPDNVVPCCIRCNKMKKALSHDVFVLHILKIASRFEVKSPQADCFSSAEVVL